MLETGLRGAAAGVVATAVMTAEQSLDKRLFGSGYDDVEILGKLVTRGDNWQPIGFALHVQNGAIFGAAYTRLKPSLPGPRSSAACWRSSSSMSVTAVFGVVLGLLEDTLNNGNTEGAS